MQIPTPIHLNRPAPLVAQRFSLPEGQSDATSILQFLEAASDKYAQSPTVREASVNLCRSLGNNDILGQVHTIVQFVRDNVTYVRDPVGSEYIVSPVKMLNDYAATGAMMGDCDDHTLLLNSMLGSVGIQTCFLGVKYGQTSVFNHVISGIYVSGQLFQVDPCAKGANQPQYQETLKA